MEMKKITYCIKPPCSKCPYQLGLVHTLVNPCPQCRENGYQAFEHFQQQKAAGIKKAENSWR